MIWTINEALRWADQWAAYDGPPNCDALSLSVLACAVRRLQSTASELATLRADNAASAKRVMRLDRHWRSSKRGPPWTAL